MVNGHTAVVTWATCHAHIQNTATMKRMRSVGISLRAQIGSSDVIHVNTGRLIELHTVLAVIPVADVCLVDLHVLRQLAVGL